MIVHVKGGTNAGTKTMRERPAWECWCGHQPGHRYSCGTCGARRP